MSPPAERLVQISDGSYALTLLGEKYLLDTSPASGYYSLVTGVKPASKQAENVSTGADVLGGGPG
jgi:hypothetical protein